MKRFVIQLSILCILILISFLLILSWADGYTDPFYKRFTTPKQNNLILGTSRSAQGLHPGIFKDCLKQDFFNYSFTVSHSPYGPVYFRSIKKKLKENTTNGIFIVTVDPWSISSRTKDPNDSVNFAENKLCLANTSIVNMNPNIEYLIKNLAGKYYTVINKNESGMFLNNDGWLEVNISMDSTSVSDRLERKLKDYRTNFLPYYRLSSLRVEYLIKTIEFLKQHGNVFLVRLPVHPKMFEIELDLLPEFDKIISPIIHKSNGYLDMTEENSLYDYTDGNHLYQESGKKVSMKIANWIKESKNAQQRVYGNGK